MRAYLAQVLSSSLCRHLPRVQWRACTAPQVLRSSAEPVLLYTLQLACSLVPCSKDPSVLSLPAHEHTESLYDHILVSANQFPPFSLLSYTVARSICCSIRHKFNKVQSVLPVHYRMPQLARKCEVFLSFSLFDYWIFRFAIVLPEVTAFWTALFPWAVVLLLCTLFLFCCFFLRGAGNTSSSVL